MSEKLCEHGILEGDFCSECFVINNATIIIYLKILTTEIAFQDSVFA